MKLKIIFFCFIVCALSLLLAFSFGLSIPDSVLKARVYFVFHETKLDNFVGFLDRKNIDVLDYSDQTGISSINERSDFVLSVSEMEELNSLIYAVNSKYLTVNATMRGWIIYIFQEVENGVPVVYSFVKQKKNTFHSTSRSLSCSEHRMDEVHNMCLIALNENWYI